MKSVEDKILALVSYADYQKGLYYDEDSIYAYDTYVDNYGKHYNYCVESQSSYIEYEIEIIKNKRGISGTCDCSQFKKTRSCKHLAACYISYSNEIFANEAVSSIQEKSKEFLNNLKKDFHLISKEQIKKELKIILALKIDFGYMRYWDSTLKIELKAKIGDKKLYALNSKFKDFYRAYKNEENYSFGSSFAYDPKLYYVSQETEEYLEFLEDFFHENRYGEFNDIYLKRFFKLLNNEILLDGNNKTIKIEDGFFFTTELKKENNKYYLDFDCDFEGVFNLTNDREYVYYEGGIYRLNLKERNLLQQLSEDNLNKLIFTDKEFNDFKNCFLPYIKNYIHLDETIDNLVITKEPDVKLYFDLLEDKVIGKVIFDYAGYEVDYTKNYDNNILRDNEFEQKVINKLFKLKFILKNNEFILEELNDMVDFLESGLVSLNEVYPVYTSSKLKHTSVIKKPNVSSTFKLGIDKVLNYHLEVEGLDTDEFKDFCKSLRLRQKYFRLKSGDIIDLESDEVKALYEIQEELEIDDEMDGKIPKYRALYLDSLKRKSKIINTDVSFDNFVNQFNTYRNNEVVFDDEEEKLLRDYQRDGVNWLYTIYKCGFGGILADEMGLGKSLQTIIFIKKILEENDKILIVCPTALVYNWENEFKKFAPYLKYEIVMGLKKNRDKVLNDFDGNIVVTSYGLLKEDIDWYLEQEFKAMIIDEAQAIKNPTSKITKTVKMINSTVKLALTGTPLENSVLELWSIFDYIMPGFLGVMGNFQSKYKLQENLDSDKDLLDGLRKQIQPFILRRKKSEVAKDLPEKIENNIFIELEEEQKKIYAKEVKDANEFMELTIKNGEFSKNKLVILSLITKLRQICLSPKIIYENYEGISAKLVELMKIVEEVILNGHKILLFTSFQRAMDLIINEFKKKDISYYVINGSVPSKKRMELVDNFNKDDTNVFLIMLKSGGTGLNLTSADVVIHFDLWWNPQAENQATDRTHRIGQTRNVDVIKLICKNTIEERILELQEKKKLLSDKLIENESTDNLIKSLTEDDIRELLRYENE